MLPFHAFDAIYIAWALVNSTIFMWQLEAGRFRWLWRLSAVFAAVTTGWRVIPAIWSMTP